MRSNEEVLKEALFSQLPKRLLQYIFNFIPPEDIFKLHLMNKYLRQEVIKYNQLFMERFQKHFPTHYTIIHDDLKTNVNKNWIKEFSDVSSEIYKGFTPVQILLISILKEEKFHQLPHINFTLNDLYAFENFNKMPIIYYTPRDKDCLPTKFFFNKFSESVVTTKARANQLYVLSVACGLCPDEKLFENYSFNPKVLGQQLIRFDRLDLMKEFSKKDNFLSEALVFYFENAKFGNIELMRFLMDYNPKFKQGFVSKFDALFYYMLLEARDPAMFHFLTEHGMDIKTIYDKSPSIFTQKVFLSNRVDVIDLMEKTGLDFVIGEHKCNALQAATFYKSLPMVKRFCHMGNKSMLNVPFSCYFELAGASLMFSPLSVALFKNHVDIANYLLNMGAENQPYLDNEQKRINANEFMACREKQRGLLIQLIDRRQENPEFLAKDYEDFIQMSIEHNFLEGVKYLFTKRVEDIIQKKGAKFLKLAASEEHYEILEFLLDNQTKGNNAMVIASLFAMVKNYLQGNNYQNAFNLMDKYPQYLGQRSKGYSLVQYLLQFSSRNNDEDEGEFLVEVAKRTNNFSLLCKDVAQNNFGKSTLHFAATSPKFNRLVEFLLENNASATMAWGKEQLTPLHTVADSGCKVIMKRMLQSLQDKNNVNITDAKGQTPLHKSVSRNLPSMIGMLCAAGADVNHKDNNGESPIFLTQNMQIISLLLEKKADINLPNNQGLTVFWKAVLSARNHNRYRIIKNYLNLTLCNLEQINPDTEETILSYVARVGTLKSIKLLIEAGALPSGIQLTNIEDKKKREKIKNYLESLKEIEENNVTSELESVNDLKNNSNLNFFASPEKNDRNVKRPLEPTENQDSYFDSPGSHTFFDKSMKQNSNKKMKKEEKEECLPDLPDPNNTL